MVDKVNNFTIKDAKYYESIIAAASDSQGDLTDNTETITHTSNGDSEKNH